MMLFLIRREIEQHGLPGGTDEREPLLEKWRETVDDFEAFAKHAETEHREFNLQLVRKTRNALHTGE